MTPPSFLDVDVNIFDDVKEWSGPFFDTHQLGVRLNFDVDVKILLNVDVDSANVITAKDGEFPLHPPLSQISWTVLKRSPFLSVSWNPPTAT